MANQEQHNSILFGGLVAGALIGTGIGLAITTRSGEGNRRYLEQRVRRLGRGAKHQVKQTASGVQELAAEKAQQVGQVVGSTAESVKNTAADATNVARQAAETAVENVKTKVGNVADVVREKADDIRGTASLATEGLRQNVQHAAGIVGDTMRQVRNERDAASNPAADTVSIHVSQPDHITHQQ